MFPPAPMLNHSDEWCRRQCSGFFHPTFWDPRVVLPLWSCSADQPATLFLPLRGSAAAVALCGLANYVSAASFSPTPRRGGYAPVETCLSAISTWGTLPWICRDRVRNAGHKRPPARVLAMATGLGDTLHPGAGSGQARGPGHSD
jgi:hypothetical protein